MVTERVCFEFMNIVIVYITFTQHTGIFYYTQGHIEQGIY
jgi:hypothetical protein